MSESGPTPDTLERIGRDSCERFVRLAMTSASGYETPEDAMLHYSSELQAMLADRVRAAVEAEMVRIRAFVEYYIRFDDGQQHRHSWHSLQDLFEAIDKEKPVDKYVAAGAPVTMRLASQKAAAIRGRKGEM